MPEVRVCCSFIQLINGEYIPDEIMTAESFEGSEPAGEGEWPAENDLENITFAYCTEFFIENLFDFGSKAIIGCTAGIAVVADHHRAELFVGHCVDAAVGQHVEVNILAAEAV